MLSLDIKIKVEEGAGERKEVCGRGNPSNTDIRLAWERNQQERHYHWWDPGSKPPQATASTSPLCVYRHCSKFNLKEADGRDATFPEATE